MAEQGRSGEPPVLARVRGAVGHLTLNRPHAINALDTTMVDLLAAALERWRTDPAVRAVVLDGAGDRGFCAGADVRALRDAVLAGHPERALDFLRREYRLDAAVADHPVPVVAVMDGITMGGGVGLAGHAAVRVVTERSVLAMPETRIGFVPDVGSTFLFSRSPGHVGTHLGATATAVGPGDAVYAGLADHHVPSPDVPTLLAALADGEEPSAVVGSLATEPAPAALPEQRAWIDECYATPDATAVLARLDAHPAEGAAQAAAALRAVSPTAVAVALAALDRARGGTLAEALALEYRAAAGLAVRPDFAEGVRALLVDKDRAPRWDPADLTDVGPELVAHLLATPVEPGLGD